MKTLGVSANPAQRQHGSGGGDSPPDPPHTCGEAGPLPLFSGDLGSGGLVKFYRRKNNC